MKKTFYIPSHKYYEFKKFILNLGATKIEYEYQVMGGFKFILYVPNDYESDKIDYFIKDIGELTFIERHGLAMLLVAITITLLVCAYLTH